MFSGLKMREVVAVAVAVFLRVGMLGPGSDPGFAESFAGDVFVGDDERKRCILLLFESGI